MTKLRAMLVVMLVVALGLVVYGPAAFAGHATTGTIVPGIGNDSWHADTFTVNDTGSLGLRGGDFVPAWVKTDCDTPVGNWDPDGDGTLNNATNRTSATGMATGCHAFGEEVLDQWLKGGWWDPRGGTEFIPPSGDHHRAGWRTMMQAHFSAGQWLAGFAPIASTFPFFPDLDMGAGPGETPVGVYELCADPDGSAVDSTGTELYDPNPGFDTDVYPMEGPTDGSDVTTDIDGDSDVDADDEAIVGDCRLKARRAGNLLLLFVDHHSEPVTPGRFPRYIPHERQAWVSTLVTKYTASPQINVDSGTDNISDKEGARISQVFRTQHGFVATGSNVSWFSMGDEGGEGCAGGWCQWLWDPTNKKLYKLDGIVAPGAPIQTSGGVPTVADFQTAGAVEVTEAKFFNDTPGTPPWSAAVGITEENGDGDGNCEAGEICKRPLGEIERAPSEIYQVIGQWVQLNHQIGTEMGAQDQLDDNNQAFWSEFWQLAGPDVKSDEGHNPNTWAICGDEPDGVGTDADFKAHDCTGAGQIDAPLGATIAITTFGLDLINRYGPDLRPNNSFDQGAYCVGGDTAGTCYTFEDSGDDGISGTGDTGESGGDCTGDGGAGSVCDRGEYTAMVRCVTGGDSDNNPWTSECLSDSVNGVFGDTTTELIYYREAGENGLRGFIREHELNNFSFANGQMAVGGGGGFFGGTLEGAIRQIVAQQTGHMHGADGLTISCLNCEDVDEHFVNSHAVPKYKFTWEETGGVSFVEHDDAISGDEQSIP
jgi:hypothetical protein